MAKTRPVRGPCLQKSTSERDWGLITNVATIQAASNFGASQSLRPLDWAVESRAFGLEKIVLEKTAPESGMSQ